MKILILDIFLTEDHYRVQSLRAAFPNAEIILGTEEDLARYPKWDIVTADTIDVTLIPPQVQICVLNLHGWNESVVAYQSLSLQRWNREKGTILQFTTVNLIFYMDTFVAWYQQNTKGKNNEQPSL